MKGYKALSMDMKAICRNGMQYEMGKLYSVKGEVIPSKNGFHFCKSIEELNHFYNIKDSRIFEVEASEEITGHDDKYVAEKIKLVREFTKEEINDYFRRNQEELIKSEHWYVRCAVAEQGYGLAALVHDEDNNVRRIIAEQGYGLDIFINDESWPIRKIVAEQNYRLDILVYDSNEYVRKAVAEQGYGLEMLIDDESPYVRAAVAKQGYGLDILINDGDGYVRRTVARQGYGLDILVCDEDEAVRQMAKLMARFDGYKE